MLIGDHDDAHVYKVLQVEKKYIQEESEQGNRSAGILALP